MKAYIFPGQGAQFSGMGKDLYDQSDLARSLFEQANEILGFSITDIMFEGSADDLGRTTKHQPFRRPPMLVSAFTVDSEAPGAAQVPWAGFSEFPTLPVAAGGAGGVVVVLLVVLEHGYFVGLKLILLHRATANRENMGKLDDFC